MRRPLIVIGGVLGVTASASTVLAQPPPTCAALNTDPAYGLVGNPVVIQRSTTLVTGNPAHCRVDVTVSERGGPQFGYADGEIQRIVIRVGLPVNSTDGGSGGGLLGEGAWNGKIRNLGGGGFLGAVGSVTAATNARGCTIWPPSNQLVQVANVVATDSGSGVAPDSLLVQGVSNEPLLDSDIVIHGGEVSVRASRSGKLEGRTYVIAARATDLAGNVATASGVCALPHDRSLNQELK